MMKLVKCPHCGDAVELWASEGYSDMGKPELWPEDMRPSCGCEITMDEEIALWQSVGIMTDDNA